MPIPFARKFGYLLTGISFFMLLLLSGNYLKSAWTCPVMYGVFGISLVLYVMCALILAADGIRLLIRHRARHDPIWKIVVDFVPMALLIAFWMI